jgi:hypothetical protein
MPADSGFYQPLLLAQQGHGGSQLGNQAIRFET